ncbi:hypothetical protein [Thermoleptolyngbya oregonensis]|nr:hypothetical protein [Thermoleptolyngbya oregonensis]
MQNPTPDRCTKMRWAIAVFQPTPDHPESSETWADGLLDDP